jgi:hypothetical protein
MRNSRGMGAIRPELKKRRVRKPGAPGAPTAKAFKQSKLTAK